MLMRHDSMHSDEFVLTLKFLAMMLGVQRTGDSAAAGTTAARRRHPLSSRRWVVA